MTGRPAPGWVDDVIWWHCYPLGGFDELVRQVRARGVRVCLDGVFNHVSREHPVVQRTLAAGPGSEEGRWLRWSGEHPLCFEGTSTWSSLTLPTHRSPTSSSRS